MPLPPPVIATTLSSKRTVRLLPYGPRRLFLGPPAGTGHACPPLAARPAARSEWPLPFPNGPPDLALSGTRRRDSRPQLIKPQGVLAEQLHLLWVGQVLPAQ